MLMSPVGVFSQHFAFFKYVYIYTCLMFQQRVLWRESQQTQVHAGSEEAECEYPSPLLLSGRGNAHWDSFSSFSSISCACRFPPVTDGVFFLPRLGSTSI